MPKKVKKKLTKKKWYSSFLRYDNPLSSSMRWHLIFLLWCQLYHIINTQNSNSSLCCESQRIYLWYHWLNHTRLQVVSWLSVYQIQSTIFQLYLLWILLSLLLRSGMQGSQLWNQLCSILGGITCQCFGDDIEGLAEFWDGDLFLAAVGFTVLVKVNA